MPIFGGLTRTSGSFHFVDGIGVAKAGFTVASTAGAGFAIAGWLSIRVEIYVAVRSLVGSISDSRWTYN